MKNLPTAFQRNALWTAITALAIAVIGFLSVGLVYLATQVLSFLQPILVPFAVAGVLAYLLEPGVQWLVRRGLGRARAVLSVFAIFTLVIGGLMWWMVPRLWMQASNLTSKVPAYTARARDAAIKTSIYLEEKYGVTLLPHEEIQKSAEQAPAPPSAPTEAKSDSNEIDLDMKQLMTGDWVKTTLPGVAKNGWNFIKAGFGGFLGMFGFMLSLMIVPLYLYYFLIESAKIKQSWSDYLPLRASDFKDEVVSCLTEINGYLIAFFRGQLFVSVINGIATGIGLMIVGLDFGLLFGLALCLLGIIPYLGIAFCWVPAVIVAAVQGGSHLLPADPWWALPLAVTGVFVIVQQIDGFFITPRIVGEAVGLHPMTVIASVLVWALLLGGLLGAILAVPMTASVKVLFQRYIWRARIAPQTVGGAREQHPHEKEVPAC
ncbi:MAG: AI-2E family transporter [Verrucomicrobiaceae bacterium]|nr:AI-2E family transporter [Verrucomicrobiaceae bacterium]